MVYGNNIKSRKFTAKLLTCSLLSAIAATAHASGYRLEFSSASVLADSGEAAVVEDAGTNWYNSAGLVDLPQQLVLGAIDVYESSVFTGTAVANSSVSPVFNFAANGKASSYPNSIIPSFHYSRPINSRFAFGISAVPAWGLKEDWGSTSMLRYSLTYIKTGTIDVAPSIAMRINDHWSVGVGPDIHWMSIQSQALARIAVNDGTTRYDASSINFGAHIGVLYRYDEHTRVGLNYRSKITQELSGDSYFNLAGVGTFKDSHFKLTIPLPPSTTLSVYHDFSRCFALMGTIAYDQWNVLQRYVAKNVSSLPTSIPTVISPANMSNSFDLGIGAHYRITEDFMWRANVKYEQTPNNNAYRAVNNPDGIKLGFEIGARYQVRPDMAVDMLYGHVLDRSTHINDINPVTGAIANGHVKTNIDLVGAQLVWNI